VHAAGLRSQQRNYCFLCGLFRGRYLVTASHAIMKYFLRGPIPGYIRRVSTKKIWSWVPMGPISRITMLAKASSKLLLACRKAVSAEERLSSRPYRREELVDGQREPVSSEWVCRRSWALASEEAQPRGDSAVEHRLRSRCRHGVMVYCS
jgi:hypothetical protein